MQLGMWSSIIIVTAFSFLVIVLDGYVVKPWREKKWERLAASGDKKAQELLRIVAGSWTDPDDANHFALARYSADGNDSMQLKAKR